MGQRKKDEKEMVSRTVDWRKVEDLLDAHLLPARIELLALLHPPSNVCLCLVTNSACRETERTRQTVTPNMNKYLLTVLTGFVAVRA